MMWLFFIIGMLLGSFFLVVGIRLPKNENVINDRSKCDKCNHILAWYDLIPVVSYICLLGKCRYCHKKISPLNIVSELAMGGVFLFAYCYYSFSYNMYIFLIIASVMFLIFVTDFSYYIILDSPLIIGSILVIILDFIYFDYKYVLFHLLSGLFLFITMLFIKILGDRIFKKESLGGGDIKFCFLMGLILGFRLGLTALILSTFLALPYSCCSLLIKKNNEVPYGPFLVSSLFIVFVFLDKFTNLLNLIQISL